MKSKFRYAKKPPKHLVSLRGGGYSKDYWEEAATERKEKTGKERNHETKTLQFSGNQMKKILNEVGRFSVLNDAEGFSMVKTKN